MQTLPIRQYAAPEPRYFVPVTSYNLARPPARLSLLVMGSSDLRRYYDMRLLNNPRLLTHLEVWTPRYHDGYQDGTLNPDGRVALLAKYKVDKATPVLIVAFTKAKHLIGQRFCIDRARVHQCELGTNGTLPCYVVPMGLFDTYMTYQEQQALREEFN